VRSSLGTCASWRLAGAASTGHWCVSHVKAAWGAESIYSLLWGFQASRTLSLLRQWQGLQWHHFGFWNVLSSLQLTIRFPLAHRIPRALVYLIHVDLITCQEVKTHLKSFHQPLQELSFLLFYYTGAPPLLGWARHIKVAWHGVHKFLLGVECHVPLFLQMKLLEEVRLGLWLWSCLWFPQQWPRLLLPAKVKDNKVGKELLPSKAAKSTPWQGPCKLIWQRIKFCKSPPVWPCQQISRLSERISAGFFFDDVIVHTLGLFRRYNGKTG
jgi:hypothetical protein